MKEINFKFFLNGKQTERELIDWQRDHTVAIIGDQVHVMYEDPKNLREELLNFNSKATIEKQVSKFLEMFNIDTIKEGSSAEEAIVTAEGVKHNKHKAPLDIVQTRQFPKAMQALALATAFGNKKYEATDKDFLNFKKVPGGSQTYFDAAARHNVVRYEEAKDSGLPHLFHAVWNSMAALELFLEENQIDMENFSEDYLKYLHNSK